MVYNFGCTAALKQNAVNVGRCKALLNIKCQMSSDLIKDTLEVMLQRLNQQPSADQLSGLAHHTTKVMKLQQKLASYCKKY